MLRHGKHIVFALLLIISANKSFAFNTPDSFYLHITVTNDQQQPLEFAIVSLLNANNNTLVKTELTDNKGKVLLNNIAGEAITAVLVLPGTLQTPQPSLTWYRADREKWPLYCMHKAIHCKT